MGDIDFATLKKNLKKDFSGFPKWRLAILGDSSMELLFQAVRGHGYTRGVNIEVFEGGFDQINFQVHDPASDLYAFQASTVFISHSLPRFTEAFYLTPRDSRCDYALSRIAILRSLATSISSHSSMTCIFCTIPERSDAVFGHYGAKMGSSLLFQLRTFNYELMRLAQEVSHVYICDVAEVEGRFGLSETHDPTLYVTSKIAWSLNFLPTLASSIVSILEALAGRIKKCVVLDLDNTLWGGVVADDGVAGIELGELGAGPAFSAFQQWLLELKERGILLAVVSKNDEVIAQEPFKSHPDTVLTLDDFAIFIANWQNKADNIAHIQNVLSIGYDAIVFVDDNPVERALVHELLPEVTVPEMPNDPAYYVPFLQSLNLFETASYSDGDNTRTKQYREEAARRDSVEQFTNLDDFLANLKMKATVTPFSDAIVPRIAQLTQRSNQFNLRTQRYDAAAVKRLLNSPSHKTLCVRLQDKFGDYGIVAVVIGEKQGPDLFIDTWLMSCRVLKRGVEALVINSIATTAAQFGLTGLIGEYIPTPKNGMVKDIFQEFGFKNAGSVWRLDIGSFIPVPHFIVVVTDD